MTDEIKQAEQALKAFTGKFEGRISGLEREEREVQEKVSTLQRDIDDCIFADDLLGVKDCEQDLAQAQNRLATIERHLAVSRSWREREASRLAQLEHAVMVAKRDWIQSKTAEYHDAFTELQSSREEYLAEILEVLVLLRSLHQDIYAFCRDHGVANLPGERLQSPAASALEVPLEVIHERCGSHALNFAAAYAAERGK